MFVPRARSTRNDAQSPHLCQCCDQRFRQSICKILLLGGARKILQRQHGNGANRRRPGARSWPTLSRDAGLNGFQRGSNFVNLLISLAHLFAQAAGDDCRERFRNVTGQRQRRLAQYRSPQLNKGGTFEWHLTTGHFVQQHTKAPDIATDITRKMSQHFWRPIRGGACDGTRTVLAVKSLKRTGNLDTALNLRKAEIQKLDVAVGCDHHIATLEIARSEPVLMRAGDRLGDLNSVGDDEFERKSHALRNCTRENLPFDELDRKST